MEDQEITILNQAREYSKTFITFFKNGDISNMEKTIEQVKVLEGQLLHQIYKLNSVVNDNKPSYTEFLRLSKMHDIVREIRLYIASMENELKAGKFLNKVKELFDTKGIDTESDNGLTITIQDGTPDLAVKDKPTEALTIPKITEQPNQTGGKAIVLFHRESCIFCQKMMDEWNKFIKSVDMNNINMRIKSVECSEGTKGYDYYKKFGVSGFPTILKFANGSITEFKGERIAENFKKFALE